MKRFVFSVIIVAALAAIFLPEVGQRMDPSAKGTPK